jgi:hypothetical protein
MTDYRKRYSSLCECHGVIHGVEVRPYALGKEAHGNQRLGGPQNLDILAKTKYVAREGNRIVTPGSFS